MLNNKYELLAVLVGSMVLFLASWLIWEVVLKPVQSENIITYGYLVKEEPNIWIYALAQFPVAVLLTFLFSNHAPSLSIGRGAFIGALICALYNISANLIILSQWNLIDGYFIITDLIGMALWGAIGGTAIAWVLRFKKM